MKKKKNFKPILNIYSMCNSKENMSLSHDRIVTYNKICRKKFKKNVKNTPISSNNYNDTVLLPNDFKSSKRTASSSFNKTNFLADSFAFPSKNATIEVENSKKGKSNNNFLSNKPIKNQLSNSELKSYLATNINLDGRLSMNNFNNKKLLNDFTKSKGLTGNKQNYSFTKINSITSKHNKKGGLKKTSCDFSNYKINERDIKKNINNTHTTSDNTLSNTKFLISANNSFIQNLNFEKTKESFFDSPENDDLCEKDANDFFQHLVCMNSEIVNMKSSMKEIISTSELTSLIKKYIMENLFKIKVSSIQDLMSFIKTSFEEEYNQCNSNTLLNQIKEQNQKISGLEKNVEEIEKSKEHLSKKLKEKEDKITKVEKDFLNIQKKYYDLVTDTKKQETEFNEAAQYFAEVYNENSVLKEYAENAIEKLEKVKDKYLKLSKLIKGTTIKINDNDKPEILFNETEIFLDKYKKSILEVGSKKVKIPSLDLSKVKRTKPCTFALINNEKVPINISLSSSSNDSPSDRKDQCQTFTFQKSGKPPEDNDNDNIKF